MTAPRIHGNRPVFSASAVYDAIANDLALIKAQDKLHYHDLGAVLGKSEDQAAKYCEGTSEMGIVAYARAKREWGGRFTGSLDQLCHDSRVAGGTDRGRHCRLLKAALAVAEALEDDGEMSSKEVHAIRATLEEARDALTELLGRTSTAPLAMVRPEPHSTFSRRTI